MTLLDTALHYADRFGWSVHPVNIKKRPITPHGRDDATRDEQMIRKWFRHGSAQVSVATGPESKLFVLDVDLDEKRGINGYETLEYLEGRYGPLPRTPHQRTGRGGMQYLFSYVDGLQNSAGKIGPGIDTRGKGGYAVVAPSRNEAGPYEWIVSPDDCPLADVPDWLVDLLREAETAQQPRTATNGDGRGYCQKMLGQAVARVAMAPDGQKHDILLKMSRWMGGFVPMLSESEIESALFAAIESQAADHRNARQTIKDGIEYGRSAPIDVPDPRQYVDTRTGEIVDRKLKPTEYVVDWRSHGTTLRDLQHKVFDPERWILENIFPEGACLLAAKYKSKKSWIALAISLAVSMNGKALGRLGVSAGRVLYLDLEGKHQRIQKRTRAMLGVRQVEWPDNFHVFTKWPRAEEGMKELDYWFESYPDTVLVVIDVLASFRRPMEKHELMYQYDRDTVDPINALFEQHHAGGLLVHHFNKGKHDDIMDSITGSTGLPSAVNTMWGLARDVSDSKITILNMRGRDLEDDEPLALRWDDYLNQHIIEGPAREVSIGAERKAIMNVLSDDEPRTPKEIAAEIGRPVESVKQLLRKLLSEEMIDKPAYGKYARIPPKSDHSDHSDHGGNSDHSDHSEVKNDGVDGKSDRNVRRVIADDDTDHSCLEPVQAVQSKSDRSDGYYKGDFFANVPASRLTSLRLYLRSNREVDQERARELCKEYQLDYEQAKKEASK